MRGMDELKSWIRAVGGIEPAAKILGLSDTALRPVLRGGEPGGRLLCALYDEAPRLAVTVLALGAERSRARRQARRERYAREASRG